MKRSITRAAVLAVSITSTVVLAACGSSGGGTSSHSAGGGAMTMSNGASMPSSSMTASGSGSTIAASGPHGKADVTFATDMIPHHGQATEMAAMALTTSKNSEVLRLATAIKGAQEPEIQTMSAWLKGWGQPVPSSSMGSMGGGMDVKGMMSDADMAKLAKTTGAAFDKMWLTMMVTHHKGAIEMANSEIADGSNAQAKALAKSIIAGQSAEVITMNKLLSEM